MAEASREHRAAVLLAREAQAAQAILAVSRRASSSLKRSDRGLEAKAQTRSSLGISCAGRAAVAVFSWLGFSRVDASVSAPSSNSSCLRLWAVAGPVLDETPEARQLESFVALNYSLSVRF